MCSPSSAPIALSTAIAFHAVAILGGINTTLNPLYTAEEAAFQLRDAGAKFLVTARIIEKATRGRGGSEHRRAVCLW